MLDLIPDVIAPLRTLYQRADEQFDDRSPQFSPEELDTVVQCLDAVSDFYTFR